MFRSSTPRHHRRSQPPMGRCRGCATEAPGPQKLDSAAPSDFSSAQLVQPRIPNQAEQLTHSARVRERGERAAHPVDRKFSDETIRRLLPSPDQAFRTAPPPQARHWAWLLRSSPGRQGLRQTFHRVWGYSLSLLHRPILAPKKAGSWPEEECSPILHPSPQHCLQP